MKRINNYVVQEIPLGKIRENSLGIRKYYNEATISELGKSISEIGLIYPIIVKPLSDGLFELVMGSRRLRAAHNLEFENIPAYVLPELGERHYVEFAIVENLQREDLTPFEEAWAILKLVNDHKMSIMSIAKRIGREESFVRRRIKLLSLPQEVQELLGEKKLSISHLGILTSLKSSEDQIEIANLAAGNHLSEEELGVLVRSEMGTDKKEVIRTGYAITSQKAVLKIKTFTRWLKITFPQLETLNYNEMLDVCAALDDLVNESSVYIKRHKGKKRDA